ncbi:hypothetical protein N9L27_01870 [Candidatus Poseidoniales archaeon]|nr:hypothetical protein [Candidatus Poseidoniales archaeon]
MRRDSHDTEALQLDSMIDIDSIIITNHARDRYSERWDSSGNIESTLYDALREGFVETQNGTIIQRINGSKGASIEVYISDEHDLGLSRLILIEKDDGYILVTIYPIEHRYLPNTISEEFGGNWYFD